ncbi:MAG: 50S ribosomal protein L29 [Deltaproteobacteria bacterium RIFCSPHIGHO2_02_FULL_40_11]|nr:MAG: 50S ribosomal protein L29 [Deltaproteobacteria bacterium RIFCSPHIGHO2_02_FULL_40_11]
MKASDLRELSLEELQKKEKDLQQELFNLNFQLKTGQLENPMKMKGVKKDIARVKTIENEKKRVVK